MYMEIQYMYKSAEITALVFGAYQIALIERCVYLCVCRCVFVYVLCRSVCMCVKRSFLVPLRLFWSKFSKIGSIGILHSKCSRGVTFENFYNVYVKSIYVQIG